MSSNAKKYFVITLSILMLPGAGFPVFAQPGQHQGSGGRGKALTQSGNRGSSSFSQQAQPGGFRGPAYQPKNFVDSRYNHNRSYPSRGQTFRSLPRDHKVVFHDHSRYYSANGVWYHYYRGRYRVIAPPVGLLVPFLPLFYTTIWFNGLPYYYANETYYIQTEGGYEVVDPPPQDALNDTPDATNESIDDRLFIYPRKGQSEEQQAKDRYECHKWSVQQTNYDPTQVHPPMPADQITQARMDYNRAMTACLDARGYTAK